MGTFSLYSRPGRTLTAHVLYCRQQSESPAIIMATNAYYGSGLFRSDSYAVWLYPD
jgi:hypothetical protein